MAIFLALTACDDLDKVDEKTCPIASLVNNELFNDGPNGELTIRSAAISGDCLSLTIEYSGGCEELNFSLVASEEVMESFPVQRNMRISFDDTDACKKLVTTELIFDLTPARPSGEGKVILRLAGWADEISYTY